ncbi:MAG: TIGR02281 family clan AA aspartic protease [Piscinibacter sp.]|uniref:retropepsin-like aspartic protease family protein n=1 Tax=Piscinibacter sp. TaxID=1903157 RepID=UPI002588CFCC|nr:TIGR02281 family clan AA aspartic protease [Piscinibacter sp.]MCW5662711.1 TIGR02281 family clan AA aspartic protease [Piscinibacter sp.]
MRALLCALFVSGAVTAPAAAQSVSMSGSLGDKALLIIDGTPRTVAAGQTVQGIKVLSVSGSETVVELNGRRQVLPLGGAQVSLGGAGGGGGGTQIVIAAGSGGHFVSDGAINGKMVRFLVDTGATSVSMSEAEAKRLGIDYSRGQAGLARTANGTVTAHRVRLASVRVGDVTVYDVEAIVVPAPMELVLLGNSFLSRFQMRRDADVLVLDKRL